MQMKSENCKLQNANFRFGICILQFAISCGFSRAADWTHWRGPEQNGVSREHDLPDRWSPNPKAESNNLIWKQPYGGRSTPIIMNGRVFFINSAGEGLTGQERVMCFDAETGKVLWEHKFNVWLADIDILRVGWTNLAGDPETGNIYAAGTQGLLICFSRDGQVIWQHSLTEEYGRITGYGGRISSPTVDGDLVIYGMLNANWGDQAGPGNRFVAFDKRTGTSAWWSAPCERPKDTYASCPVVAVINGERLLITGAGDGGIYALRVRTGEKVWSYMISVGGLSSSPVVEGNRVYICHGAENLNTEVQGKVVCLDVSQIKDGKPILVWEKPGIKVRYSSPAIHDGRLYVCDETARLHCLDAATGKPLWRRPFSYGRNAKGAPVWADGKIYVADVNSRFHILKPGDKDCKELHAQFFPSPDGVSDVEINGNAAVANGRVYFATSFEFFCTGKKNPSQSGRATPPSRIEEPASPNAKPAHLQVVPADVLLEPGESAQFKVRAFDDKGRFLKEIPAQWSLPAPPLPPPAAKPAAPAKGPATGPPPLKGEISADGLLKVDSALPGQFGFVESKADGLAARARVRVVSHLPIRQDFEKIPEGRTPGGWVNCQGKFVVESKDGSKVLRKLANNASPLFARAYTYVGKPTWHDYTIQADVMGLRKGENMSDVGIAANRYTLVMDGNKQELRIISWESTPHPRVEQTIPWSWSPNEWYTLKLTVDARGDKGHIRGKAWPRGQPEPKEWTIEFEDPVPNREGAPALYAYSIGIIGTQPGADLYYDNVTVTPNK
jgi:outer membrane protein assembly factor BamB